MEAIWQTLDKISKIGPYQVRGFLSNLGIVNKASWLFYQYLIFAFSFFCAVCFYIGVYNMTIPTVHQSTKLYLSKTDTGYLSRIFNSEGDFPLCKEATPISISPSLSKQEIIYNKICANPIDLGVSELTFGLETYEISVSFVLPETSQNIKIGEAVPIYAEFISQNNEIVSINTEGVPASERFGIKSLVNKVSKSVGLTSGDLTVTCVISEKFVNYLFDLNVINIEIRHPGVVAKSGTIETRVVLAGIRRLMSQWFWTMLVFGIGFLTVCWFLGINFLFRLLGSSRKAVSGEHQKNDREPNQDEKRAAQAKKQHAQHAQKRGMDSFLEKLD